MKGLLKAIGSFALGITLALPVVAAATVFIVPQGGTGGSTFTAHGVLLGEGTGAIQATAAGTAGQVLTSNGASLNPTFQALTVPTADLNTWLATKTTADLTEGARLYFTNARGIAATLTGYTSGAGTVSSSDTILGAIQKLNGNIAALTTGVSSVFGRTGAVVAVSGDYTTDQVTEGTNQYYTAAKVNAVIDASSTVPHVGGSAYGNVLLWNGSAWTAVGTSTSLYNTASASTGGLLSSADWTTFNSKGSGTVTAVSVASSNGFTGSSSGGATPILTLTTSITGILKGNGTAIAAAAYTDFPTIAANTVLGNITGSTAAPTALATSTLFNTAASGVTGLLSGTDWTTFNAKAGTASPTFTGTAAFAAATFSGTTAHTGLATFGQASSTRMSVFDKLYVGGTATTTIDSAGNLSVAGTTVHTGGTTLSAALTYGGVALNNAVTGTGNMVLSTSPVLTTPNLGTPTALTLTSATGLPISGITGLGTGVGTALAVNVGSAGAFVTFNGALGTPSSGTLTSATGLPVSTGISGFGTGVATALAVNTGSSGAFVVNGGALGTPSSGTLTNATGLPVGGLSNLGTGVGTWLITPSSANLISALTDETGTGSAVFSISPTFTGTTQSAQASSTRLSVHDKLYVGGTATTTIDNAGNLSVAGTSLHTGATTLSAALTYGGVALNNAVTGTGNMVLSAAPTLTGTLTAAIANFSGLTTHTSGFVSQASSTVVGNFTTTGNTSMQNASTTGLTSSGQVTFSALTGTAASCLYVDTNGKLAATGAACGSAVGGTVTSVGLATPNSTLTLGGTNPVTTTGTINADINLAAQNIWTGASTTYTQHLALNNASTSQFTISGASWLGTPTALTLTNATGLPVSSGISGFGTGVATALAVNVGSAGAFTTFNGALGTPSSLTLTNATGLPVAGLSNLGSNVGTFLITPSSSNLAAAITDETGTGSAVFSASPTFTGTAAFAQASSTRLSIFDKAYFGGSATSTFSSDGSLNLVAALTYGGVTLSNAVTGTGNMVLSASPTFSGTIGGALTFSGTHTLSSALTYGGVTLSNAVTGTGNMVLSAAPTFTGTPTFAGFISNASTTIGGGATTTGLTIAGTATTTGNQIIQKSTQAGGQNLTDAATINIDWLQGNTAYVVLGATGRTVTFSNVQTYMGIRFFIGEDGTGSRTITSWPTTVRWQGGSAPTLTTTASKFDICSFITATSTAQVFGACTLNY